MSRGDQEDVKGSRASAFKYLYTWWVKNIERKEATIIVLAYSGKVN